MVLIISIYILGYLASYLVFRRMCISLDRGYTNNDMMVNLASGIGSWIIVLVLLIVWLSIAYPKLSAMFNKWGKKDSKF